MEKTVYIVLTDTGTWLSRAIRLYTGKRLNHVSIAFDDTLHLMYSFGRKRRTNPFIGGFVKECVMEGVFRNASCVIYQLQVNAEDWRRMYNAVQQFERNADQFRYNFIGLFGILFHRDIGRKNAYFCSQFVATILNTANTPYFTLPPHFVEPHHFEEHAAWTEYYRGNLHEYRKENAAGTQSNSTHVHRLQTTFLLD